MNLERNKRSVSVQINCFSIMKFFLCITIATLCSGSAVRIRVPEIIRHLPSIKPPIDACSSREYRYSDSCCCPLICCPLVGYSHSCLHYSNPSRICCCPRRHCPTLPPITLPPTTLPPPLPPCPPNPSL